MVVSGGGYDAAAAAAAAAGVGVGLGVSRWCWLWCCWCCGCCWQLARLPPRRLQGCNVLKLEYGTWQFRQNNCAKQKGSISGLHCAKTRVFACGSLDLYRYLRPSVASPFPLFDCQRLLCSLDLLCLCFFLLRAGVVGGGGGADNVHANAACI